MGSIIGIIAGCGMLMFGLVFFWFLQDDGSIIGQVFMTFWMLMVILMIGYYVYNMKSQKASSVAMGEIELDLPSGSSTPEEKLRSLERLKKERLITEQEYLQKRAEIMEQRW